MSCLQQIPRALFAALLMLPWACTPMPQILPDRPTSGSFVQFSLPSREGSGISTRDFRGSHLLLHFWATWCVPCAYELSSLQRFASALHDDELAVLIVAVESDWDAVDSFLAARDITLPAALDRHGSLKDAFRLSGVPTTYLLDSEGFLRNLPDPAGGQLKESVTGPREWAAPSTIERYRSFLAKTTN